MESSNAYPLLIFSLTEYANRVIFLELLYRSQYPILKCCCLYMVRLKERLKVESLCLLCMWSGRISKITNTLFHHLPFSVGHPSSLSISQSYSVLLFFQRIRLMRGWREEVNRAALPDLIEFLQLGLKLTVCRGSR